MRAVFVETREFTRWLTEHLPDLTYAEIQQKLMQDPDLGDVMPGCGGLRKLTTSDTGRRKGKRGGVRIIYLYVPEAKRFFLLDIYGKDEQDDLSVHEQRELAKLAQLLKTSAKSAAKNKGASS